VALFKYHKNDIVKNMLVDKLYNVIYFFKGTTADSFGIDIIGTIVLFFLNVIGSICLIFTGIFFSKLLFKK
jgi:hypothetical protein